MGPNYRNQSNNQTIISARKSLPPAFRVGRLNPRNQIRSHRKCLSEKEGFKEPFFAKDVIGNKESVIFSTVAYDSALEGCAIHKLLP
jgi:hypothetical protein